MKSPVRKFRPELERLMEEARETIAAERFDPVRVKGELSAAAKEGRSSCVLQVEGSIDLRKSVAAVHLMTWLEGQWLRAEWMRRSIGDADGEAAWDLRVSWKSDCSIQHD